MAKSQLRRIVIIGVVYLLVTGTMFYGAVLLARGNGPLGLRQVLATVLDVAWCLPITIGRMVHSLPPWVFAVLVLVNAVIAAFVISTFVDVLGDRRKSKPVDADDAAV